MIIEIVKMKVSKHFKKAIEKHLEQKAFNDPRFNDRYNREDKNIDDCITYILNTVKESGVDGFTDGEIYGMANHYFDEDKIDVGKDIDMRVVVNHTVQLTEEEIEEQRAKAKQKVFDDAVAKMHKPKASPKKEEAGNQQTLF